MKCVCGYSGDFGPIGPNGARESLVCPSCLCTSRQRAVALAVWGRLPQTEVYQVGVDALSTLLANRAAHFRASELKATDRAEAQDLENLTFKGGTFDVVVCSDVLEHVRLYGKALSELIRVTASGGIVAITVPFAPNPEEHFSFCAVSILGPEHDLWAKNAPRHDDPLDPAGCPVYRTYGLNLLMRELLAFGMKAANETQAQIPEFGIVDCPVIVGAKA